VHIYGETTPSWRWSWGPPHDRRWIEEDFSSNRAQTCVLFRVLGQGADLLFGLEQGLHRFHGIAGEGAHVWVDLLEPRGEIQDAEWNALPGPPAMPRVPRGTPMREVTVGGERTLVEGDDVDITWDELPGRLTECAVTRLLSAHARKDGLDDLWMWEHPLQEIEAMLRKQAQEKKP